MDAPKAVVEGKGLAAGAAGQPGTLRGFYILGLLTLTYTLNTADRGLLNILLPPLKREFALADWQLGILVGPLFALIYAVCSIPFAGYSDRGNRRGLIALTMVGFSAATAWCGLATSYVHLMLGRFGTGAAEAGTVPAATSIIADVFGPRRRVWAMAIFSAGGGFGATVASLIGGLIAYHFGWRYAFFALGLPGIIIGIVMFLTVREPARTAATSRDQDGPPLSMVRVVGRVFSQPAFRWLCVGNTVLFFHNTAAHAFQSLFLVQTHGLDLRQIGSVGSAMGLGGLVITLVVGRLCDPLAARDVRWLAWIPMIVALGGIPFALILLLSPHPWVAMVMGGAGTLFVLAYAAPMYAAVQQLVPGPMRARAIAFLLLLTNLIGTGLGPPAAGLLSGILGHDLGEYEGLRWSLIVLLLANVVSGYAFWRASRTLKHDIAGAAALNG